MQTFLALLAVLVALSSCSQMAPPHPGDDLAKQTAAQEPQPTALNSGFVNAKTNYVDTNTPGLAQIDILDDEASVLYEDLTLIAKQTGGLTSVLLKAGRHLNCLDDTGNYSCSLTLNLASGLFVQFVPEDQVKTDPQATSPLSSFTVPSPYLNLMQLPMSQHPSRVRIFIPTAMARVIYENLHVDEVLTASDPRYASVWNKNTDGIACSRQNSKDGSIPLYFCDIYLDVSTGTVDKPSEDGPFYF